MSTFPSSIMTPLEQTCVDPLQDTLVSICTYIGPLDLVGLVSLVSLPPTLVITLFFVDFIKVLQALT